MSTFKEQYPRNALGSHFDAISCGTEHEIFVPKATGKVHDIIYNLQGEVVEDRGWDHNVVVNNASIVIAALMAGAVGYAGCSYWAIGSGATSWDTTPYTPVNTDALLTDEVYRKSIPPSSISFLDTNGNVTTTPTNVIQIQLTFGSNEANYSWREFGIFGGNAGSALNSGLMINHKVHSRIDKTTALSIARTLQFTW